LGTDKNCSGTPTGKQTLGERLQPSCIRGCNPPHGKELHAIHFHFCKLLFLQIDVPGVREDRQSCMQKGFHRLSSKERSFSKQPMYLGTSFQPAQAHSLFHFGLQIMKITVSIPSSSSALSLTFIALQDGVLIMHMV